MNALKTASASALTRAQARPRSQLAGMKGPFVIGSEQAWTLEAGTVPQLGEVAALEVGAGHPSLEDQFRMDSRERPQLGLSLLLRGSPWTANQGSGSRVNS